MTRRRTTLVALTAVAVAVGAACAPPPPPSTPPTNPLTLGASGVPGNGAVLSASISGDGNVVAFTSAATNLVPGDTNGVPDLFVRTVPNGSVTRIAEQVSGEPRVSTNGRFVSYRTSTGQLAVHDRTAGTTASWTPATSGFGPVTPIVPPDGSVAISGVPSSFGIAATACRVRTLATGAEQDCPAGGPGFGQLAFEAASPNGRHVMYSWIDQSGGGTSGRFVWDRLAGTTTLVPPSVAVFPSFGVLGDDGRSIVLTQVLASGFGSLVVYDLPTATVTTMPGPVPDGTTVATGVSNDGSTVSFVSQATNLVPADTNGAVDTFRWNLDTGTVVRTSVTIGGGAQLPNGANRCGTGPGQTTTDGVRTCGLTVDPAAAIDTNGTTDAYRLG